MLFWWSMIKLKRKKYKLMKEIYKLQQEYLKWNSTNDGKGNERTRVKHSIEKIYEEIDCVEREIYELETERFLNICSANNFIMWNLDTSNCLFLFINDFYTHTLTPRCGQQAHRPSPHNLSCFWFRSFLH